MKLLDLKPKFVGSGGEGIEDASGNPVPHRHGIGLMMNCPCGCGSKLFVPFRNPLDGLPGEPCGARWTREGEAFETMTLSPSIRRIPDKYGACGYPQNGTLYLAEAKECF